MRGLAADIGAGDTAGNSTAASLSFVCMTAGPGARVTAILEALRPVADEIIVALDARADDGVCADVATVADRVVRYPFAEPVDRPLPWLFRQCRGEWALTLDDDEIPSLALLDALPTLCANAEVTHYWLPRRWLFPDVSTYLDDSPWRPDYQLRLVRTDPRLVRFSSEFHRPIVAAGPGGYPQLPVWHADPLLRTFEQRLEKARRYEQMRPGMRIAGRALNVAFYTPELRDRPPLAPLPADERCYVESVLAAERPTGPARAAVEHVTREEIDAEWPDVRTDAHAGRVVLIDRPRELAHGELRTIDVRVHNTGTATWQWGGDPVAQVRIGSRWYDASGREVPEAERHGEFPAPLRPGETAVVPVPVQAPELPGQYRLELDLVHEHVRRLGAAASTEVDVLPPRRVVVFGDEVVPHLLEADPALEPVVLCPVPSRRPGHYAEAHDLHAYLLDGLPPRRTGVLGGAAWRTARLVAAAHGVGMRLPRGADDFLEAVRGSRLLVIDSLGTPLHRRELWRAFLAIRAASALGVPTALRRGALGDSALARAVGRGTDHAYAEPSELVAVLAR